MHREGTVAGTDGVLLSWQAWLPAGEPVASIALLHGGAEHGGRYGRLVAHLVAREYAVYAVDLRGHGRSQGRRGTVRQFSDYVGDLGALRRLMSDQGAVSPTFLIGYSLGGLVCASYALDHQDELAGVILAGPALGVGDGVSPLQFRLARLLAAVAPRLPLFRMDPAPMMQDPAAVRAYRADPLVMHGRFDARLIAEFVGAMRRFPERIGELQIPLLVLHGAADVTADPRGSTMTVELAGSDDKTLNLYEGMRHDIFNEPGHERVCADVSTWLETRIVVGVL
jgi:alpha-beta hydrolase superfamily lysophospholipase